jgi:hypothetical protein
MTWEACEFGDRISQCQHRPRCTWPSPRGWAEGEVPGREVPGRVWDEDRRAQGFTSQAHLDRWYAYADHVAACAECGTPGPGYDGPDGWQPTVRTCPAGQALLQEV